jgi:hypothetical protein
MAQNLLRKNWKDVPSDELTFILQELTGGRGQYRDRVKNPRKFYLPLWGESCKLELTYSKRTIEKILPGPAFDRADWDRVVHEIQSQGQTKIGRDISFSSFRVRGSWRGERSGVQILPLPASPPDTPESAEHPFVLEFPVRVSDVWRITDYRRRREHRRMTGLLNILLAGNTSALPQRTRNSWAILREEGDQHPKTRWVQEGFFTDFGDLVSDHLSTESGDRIEQVESAVYFDEVVHDGRNLQVPTDLDDSIRLYLQLPRIDRQRFDKASFWIDMAFRQWTISLSACFASLVTAVEALAKHSENPRGLPPSGPTKRFKDFIKTYSFDTSAKEREAMYGLRSDILHGDDLMMMDENAHLNWSPPDEIERNLLDRLWRLTRIAARNWLRATGDPEQGSSS